jgi:hypothetical protein
VSSAYRRTWRLQLPTPVCSSTSIYQGLQFGLDSPVCGAASIPRHGGSRCGGCPRFPIAEAGRRQKENNSYQRGCDGVKTVDPSCSLGEGWSRGSPLRRGNRSRDVPFLHLKSLSGVGNFGVPRSRSTGHWRWRSWVG